MVPQTNSPKKSHRRGEVNHPQPEGGTHRQAATGAAKHTGDVMSSATDVNAVTRADSGSAKIVALGIFAVSYGTNVSTPFLVLYKDRLSLSPSQTMAIFVVYVAGIFSTLFVAGPISDRYGRRALVVPFIVVSAFSSVVLILGRDSFGLLLGGRALLGMVSGCVLGVGAAWLQELMGRGNEQRAAVLLTVVTYIGFGFGPVTSALLYEAAPHPLIIPFVFHAVGTLMLVPGLMKVRETVVIDSPATPIRLAFGVPAGHRRSFLLKVVPAALWVFAYASVSFALFPVLLADSFGGSAVVVAGAAGTLTAMSGVIARPLVNRVGASAALPIGVALGASGYILGTTAYFLESWPILIPTAIVLGTSSGTLTAGCLTLLGEMSDAKTRGACVSTFYLLAYPGMAMPLLITTIAASTSTDAALIGMCIVGTIAAASVYGLSRMSKDPSHELLAGTHPESSIR